MGWCKNDGKWKGSQRKIDCYPEKKMGYLSLYKITEHPELIILKIGPKIYFVEKTIPFNASDFDKPIISGSEKTLINISNELAKNDMFKNRNCPKLL